MLGIFSIPLDIEEYPIDSLARSYKLDSLFCGGSFLSSLYAVDTSPRSHHPAVSSLLSFLSYAQHFKLDVVLIVDS